MLQDLSLLSDTGRFWSRVVEDPSGCWLWTGGRNHLGYGHFYGQIAGGKKAGRGAHRVAYEMLREEIEAGFHIDHLCCNRSCVNPWHMEQVTPTLNMQRAARRGRLNGRPQSPYLEGAGEWYGKRTILWRDDPGVWVALPSGKVTGYRTASYWRSRG